MVPTGALRRGVRRAAARVIPASALALGIVVGLRVARPEQALARTVVTPPEYQLLALLNADRQANGLTPLTLNDALTAIAHRRSQQLLKTGVLTHFDPNGAPVFAAMLGSAGFPYLLAGENLARNNYPDLAKSLEIACSGLMASPTHRANILSPAFNEVGLGVAGPDSRGSYYYAEIFAQVPMPAD